MDITNIKSRLGKEERKAVFQMHCGCVPITQIAEKFKVSRPTIYNIIEMERKNQTKNDFYISKLEENKDMSNLISKKSTNFLGITIDTENGSNNPKINKALNKSLNLLDITQFIKVTKFKINNVMFDYFWQVVVGHTPSLVGRRILEWFGYEGEYFNQKKCFKKMLNNNGILYRELTQMDDELTTIATIEEELQLIPSNVVNTKFLIMEPRDLKMAIMQLKTKNGHIIRDYYIDLEELLKLYTEYTLYFNHRESQRKITNLEKMMVDLKITNKNIEESNKRLEESNQRQEKYMRSLGIQLEDVKDQNEVLIDDNKEVKRKLGIAVEDRAPLPEDEDIQERFVLIKRNDDEHYQYYTIRAQYKYTERRIKTQRLLFPQLEILLDFKANPNSKTLYNRIKKELKATGVIFNGNNIDLEDSEVDEQELIDKMKITSNQKYNI
ncbi:hypothetical protein IIV25_026R [Invertebrate iridovirus 25]|uniref:Uncharacterized protein n=1 Tax=Invertebrate iridovirus 25 TaxID=1301280 RepID=W8W2S4_9VIRU|nr:hypothetical protein IIV25_026R [Invertebrate iridovirus 25]CCV02044.1 hypothetical protein IIV25_026R [Invertebrate iridovirus 25]